MTTTNDIHPMVMKAARAMAEHEGEKYGPSAWELYSHAYLAMAQAALTECGALECLSRAESFIDGIREELHQRRVCDWYPEGAHNAAAQMSEDMRLIGNACADFNVYGSAPK